MSSPPPDPPPPDWDASGGASAEFDNAQLNATKYGYDSTNLAFKDSTGAANYLYVGKSATTGHVAWFLRPTSNSGNCPQGKIPLATFNVVKNGTLDTQSMIITASGHTYLLYLQTDTSGVQIAYAKQLT